MKIELESGKFLEITLVDIKLATELLRVVKNKLTPTTDIPDICLDKDILKLALECGKKAFYDGKRVESLEVFEDNRADMLEVIARIIGENINPFSKTPLIKF